jgi:hypothetical protein
MRQLPAKAVQRQYPQIIFLTHDLRRCATEPFAGARRSGCRRARGNGGRAE